MIEAKKGMIDMKKQQGAVSIFVVIFAMLLFAAVSVGFTVLMLRDQDRATDNDLSQSALDSAKAGVEDAKRVLSKYNDCYERGQTSSPDCSSVIGFVRSNSCDTVARAIGGEPGKERLIQQSDVDEALRQAYTCVKVTPDTEDVVKTIRHEGEIRLVPLKPKMENGAPDSESYNTVEISWHERRQDTDYKFTAGDKNELGADKNSRTTGEQLPTEENWQEKWGSVLRVQAINYTPGAVNPGDIDKKTRTAFLYPSPMPVGGGRTTVDLTSPAVDSHRPLEEVNPRESDGSGLDGGVYNRMQRVGCTEDEDGTPESAEMVCTARMTVRPDTAHQTYLAVAGIYQKGTPIKFKVRMLKDDTPIKFDGVQPSIDATGRANDVFRRIEARVETHASLEDAMPLPRAALGSRGDICKAYIVTDHIREYRNLCVGNGGANPEYQPTSAQDVATNGILDGGADEPVAGDGGSTPTAPGGGTGTGDTGGSSLPAPYKVMISGKEYTVTPRLKVERECTGVFWNRTCKDVRYAEHVYIATEERCTGLPWNRTCKDVQVEKIHKTERL